MGWEILIAKGNQETAEESECSRENVDSRTRLGSGLQDGAEGPRYRGTSDELTRRQDTRKQRTAY